MYVLYAYDYPYSKRFDTLQELVGFIDRRYLIPTELFTAGLMRTYYTGRNCPDQNISVLVSRILRSRREARNGTINKTAAHKSLN
jgi:hypothetical protein